jgi:hypothetical protein
VRRLALLVASLVLLVPAGAFARGDQVEPGGGGPFPCQPGNGSLGVQVTNIYPYGWRFQCGYWGRDDRWPPVEKAGWGLVWNCYGSACYVWHFMGYS